MSDASISPGAFPATPLFTAKQGLAGYVQSQQLVATNANLGNGSLRLSPMVLTKPVTFIGIGGEYTVAGDAASYFRPCIYGDDGTYFPGALILDGGTAFNTGGAPAVVINSIQAITLQPGVYWTGGVVQNVSSVQPTMRTGVWLGPFAALATALPAAGSTIAGYAVTGITGALPSSFPALPTSFGAATIPRTLLQLQ